jgi:hypothetical protein
MSTSQTCDRHGVAWTIGLLTCWAGASACGSGATTGSNKAPIEIDGSMADDGPQARDATEEDATAQDATADSDGGASPPDAQDSGDGASNEGAAPQPEAAAPEASGAPDGPPGPTACGLTPCAPGQPCPDLIVDREDLIASIVIQEQMFAPTSCAVEEGCITQTGLRRLLRFDTGTINLGSGDLHIGDPTQNACFTFSQCHQHYHFRGVGRYTLYASDGKTVVATGHKQGFCLEDVYPYPGMQPPAPQPAMPFTCNDQGLHVGFEDVYPNDIDCQWIDITGVAAGAYVLSVIINGDELLPESNYDNNEVRIQVNVN